ncbi:MAG TPA: tetratricopeptide repeat protein, partial [Candidatus Sabulitectum sp.]|nr:tetratricopeptide repeat protein [Candidatus Sabulitectum sp.]
LHTAEPGTLFGPARTNQGLTLFMVTDRLEEGVKPLEEARESIEAALRPQMVNEYLYETIFPMLRERYQVEINEAAFLPSESIGPDSLMTLAQETMGTDPATAVEYFKLFIDRYPDNERCDQAQFLIGFTFSEQMRDYDSARAAFRVLVETYPESELADDAQWMIENMEIPIEEFIPADTAVEEPDSL